MTITTKTVTLYTFDSLPTEEAKEAARDWWRGLSDSSDFDHVIDDAKAIGALFGYDIDDIWWSGFCHQGQGVVAEGYYGYKKGGLRAVKEYAPNDTQLHDIVKRIQDVQNRYSYQLYTRVEESSYTLKVATFDTWLSIPKQNLDEYLEIDELEEALKDFSAWIYSNLDKENDYQNSDEYIDDALIANEYTFTVDGERQD